MGYDFVVVGAGSAGAIVASRLSEDPAASVVLIEAGPDYPRLESLPDEIKLGHASASYVVAHDHLWNYRGRPTAVQDPQPFPRGKVVGGTGAVNGQVFLRGVRDDFEDWAATGNDGWGFDSLLPAFKRLEHDLDFADQWHGDRGPIEVRRYPESEWLPPAVAFHDACVDSGFPFAPDANAPGAAGMSPIPFNNVGGIRASSALTYLGAARGRPNLMIRDRSLAARLRLDHRRVTGVEVLGPDGPELIEGDQFIVCAGSVGSPQLLLLSGIGPAGHLGRVGVPVVVDLPGVGEGLQDHQVADLLWRAVPEFAIPPATAPRVQVALRYTAADSPFANDMQLTARLHPLHQAGAPGPGEEDLAVVSLVPCLERAVGAGHVRLAAADPGASPEIELNFLAEEADLRRLREGVRLALELAEHAELRSLLKRRMTPTDDDIATDRDLDAWLLRSVRTSHHSCCSCRMGPESDPMAVVDREARVRGIDNLRVVDASMLPAVPRANTNATVMAAAERVVELMSGDR